ncbi:MAG: PAS domain S-box protein [Ferruginibacter sp.]
MSNSFILNPAWFTRKRILLAALLFSLILLGSVVYWFALQNKWLIADYHKQNEMSIEQDKFQDLFLSIQSAESASRGYAGSGNPKFMTGFPGMIDSIRSHFRQLTKFQDTRHSAIDPVLFSQLDRLVKDKIEFMLLVKQLCEKNKCDTARSLIATAKGLLLTDSILAIHHTANASMLHILGQSKRIFNAENNKYYNMAYWGITTSIFLIAFVVILLLREIKRAESATGELLLQKEHLGITLKSIGEGLITTGNDGRIVYMNPAAEILTGWSNLEVKGKPLQSVYNVSNEETGLPFENIVNQILQKGRTVELENNTILRSKNEENRVISNNGSPLMDLDGNVLGAVLVFNDITDRKRDEEKIKKAIERYEILSKATSDTIWDWDIVNDSMLYNHSITQMFGYTKAEIENGANWWRSNLHPDDYENITMVLDREFKKRSQTIQFEYRYRCADQSYKNIRDRAFVVYNTTGLPIRMIGAMQDITKEKEHERRIAIAITDAQEKERRELGMELHDNVNQLLGATLLYMGVVIKSGNVGKEESDVLKNCVEYVHEAIKDLRNLSHRLTPYTKEEVSLKRIIELLIEPMQKTKQFDIILHVDPFETDAINSEIQTNLYRIVQEQLTNILKHAEASQVKINVRLTKKLIKLSIADNGKGFDPCTLKDGIGLENIKRRAEMFSGKCKFKSSPGNGCELMVEIPLKTEPKKIPQKTRAIANLSA